jgi:iron complex transport system ATP-binding protein
MMKSFLQANNISLGYNGHNIIEALSLSVPKNKIFGLIGPNGSGKTTLLRALAGLMKPRGGAVYLHGSSISQLESQKRARMVGWVPQREALAWPLTVGETVQLGRAPHRGWFLPYTSQDSLVVERALQQTELVALQDRPIDKLSGGEFQRVLIARALAQEPELLLLDEPTANLDVHHQIQVLDLVRGLVRQGDLTVVMAIHDLNLAARYCDRLVLMHEGELQGIGGPEEVLTTGNLRKVFGIEAKLYRDPWGDWAVGVRAGSNGHGSKDSAMPRPESLAA